MVQEGELWWWLLLWNWRPTSRRPDEIIATIKQEKGSQLQKLIANTLQENVVSSEVLQSLTGKLSDAARLLTAWMPFLRDLWAALTGDTLPGAHNGHI